MNTKITMTRRRISEKKLPFCIGKLLLAIIVLLGILLSGSGYIFAAPIPGGTLSPVDVDKYVAPLVKPPAMPGDFKNNKDK
jgi:hypothetical protein